MSFLTLLVSHPLLALLTLLAILLVTWIRYIKRHYYVFKQLGIPGPEPTFLLGNSMAFANKFPMDVFKEWQEKYGEVFGFYEGLRPSVVVSCPDLAYKILVKHFNQFPVRPVINPFQHEHQDLSLQNVSGALWKRQRQAVNAGMTTRAMREMFSVMCDVTDQLMSWFDQSVKSSSQGFYVDDIVERYSLDWFAQAALGYHSDALTNEKNILLCYMRASHESMSPDNVITGIAKLFPLFTRLLKPLDRQHKKISRLQTRDVTNFVRSLQSDMSQRVSAPGHNIIYNLLTKKVSDIRPHLSDETGNDGSTYRHKSQLNESEIVGEVSGLVGGGVGPISSALTFCIYCLAVYQEEQTRLRVELESVIQATSCVKMEELDKLEAMGRFILETLRMYPVAPGVSRECVTECQINGVHFRPGHVIRVMASNMYCRPEYFPEPHIFKPDRFLPKPDSPSPSLPTTTHHVTAFLPFGLGPRMCVGQRLALLSLKLALTRLLQDYLITPSHVTQIPLQVALRPFLVSRDGVHVKMEKRKKDDVI